MSTPWLKFYPSDWRADPALRMCSIAARGLWMEMLCVMHEAQPRGCLLVNGRAVNEQQLACLAGLSVDDIVGLLNELENAGVFSREDDGTIYSRRMRRDQQKAEEDKANGKRGGSPLLKGDNRGVTPPHKAQKPEARDQKKKEEASPLPKKRGTRLPDDWEPDTEAATKVGLGEQEALREADKFRDYWRSTPGQKGVKLDWPATWRNWCRNAVERRGHAANRKSDRPSMHDVADRMLREAEERAGGFDSS